MFVSLNKKLGAFHKMTSYRYPVSNYLHQAVNQIYSCFAFDNRGFLDWAQENSHIKKATLFAESFDIRFQWWLTVTNMTM